MGSRELVLTKRDIALLRFVGEGGIASLGQLHHRFWESRAEKKCRVRLRGLVREGWLSQKWIDLRKPGEAVFMITPGGAKLFGYRERQRFMVGLPPDGELAQQLMAQEARLTLEKKLADQNERLVEWQNERELRREETKNSSKLSIFDAAGVVKDSNGHRRQVWLECDGGYYGQMLRQKIRAVGASGKTVYWVTYPKRCGRVSREIECLGVTNISVLVVEAL